MAGLPQVLDEVHHDHHLARFVHQDLVGQLVDLVDGRLIGVCIILINLRPKKYNTKPSLHTVYHVNRII